jgi:prepilin-type processing-associated H-X9-DG protein
LIELLTVVAIVGMLAAIAIPVLGGARSKARALTCLASLRTLGQGIALYAQDNKGEFPRSLHSAGAHSQPGWAVSVAPYLGAAPANANGEWAAIFNRYYRCSEDSNTDPMLYSFGLNVYFELTPAGDDYAGSPATWRRLTQVPSPARTILLAETRPVPFGDHLMAHFWGGVSAAKNALAHDRHSGRAHYVLCDGHVSSLRAEETFDPAAGRDLWNPSKAR